MLQRSIQKHFIISIHKHTRKKMSNNVSQSPSFDLSKTPPKLSNKQVLFKNNNKPTKRSTKSRYNKNNMLNYNTTIDNSSSYSHKNNNKNNKPLKVVHISNPMRFHATAAEFRALVQGLTGRDAVVVDDDVHCRGTHQAITAAGGDDDDDGGHHGCDNSNDDDDDDKVLLHHHHHHHDQHQHQHQQEVNLSACFGPSDHMSFDYVGAFNGDLVLMEELRAFMGDDGYYY